MATRDTPSTLEVRPPSRTSSTYSHLIPRRQPILDTQRRSFGARQTRPGCEIDIDDRDRGMNEMNCSPGAERERFLDPVDDGGNKEDYPMGKMLCWEMLPVMTWGWCS